MCSSLEGLKALEACLPSQIPSALPRLAAIPPPSGRALAVRARHWARSPILARLHWPHRVDFEGTDIEERCGRFLFALGSVFLR